MTSQQFSERQPGERNKIITVVDIRDETAIDKAVIIKTLESKTSDKTNKTVDVTTNKTDKTADDTVKDYVGEVKTTRIPNQTDFMS